MYSIVVKNLKKYYSVYQKEAGVLGSIKSVFSRKYFDVKAVDNISLKLNEGELVGFIGPNGAGKTTTLKCLSGLLYPTSGEIEVMGYKPFERKKEFLKQVSIVMGQKNQLWWDLPAIETFYLNKEIFEVSDDDFKRTTGDLIEMMGVEKLIKVQVRKLSLGERMKMEIIAGLIHSPKILFLDEPTIGLDVVMQKKLREFVKEYNQKYKATIILTSHYMDDVKELCDRVVLINNGNIVFDNSLSKLMGSAAKEKTMTIILDKEADIEKVKEIGKVSEYDFPKLVLSIPRKEMVKKAVEAITMLGATDINIEEPKIEDIIRDVFQKEAKG